MLLPSIESSLGPKAKIKPVLLKGVSAHRHGVV